MIRAPLLLLLLPATALAQTADAAPNVAPVRERTGPVTTVVYDLTKLVKGKGELKSVGAVRRCLVEEGYLREPAFQRGGDPVEELPKCQLRVTTPESIQNGIRAAIELWQKDANSALQTGRVGLVPPGALVPPVAVIGLPRADHMARPVGKKKR